MRRRAFFGVVWFGTVALLVLAARWLAYALADPSPLAHRLEGSAGGPDVVVVTLVSLGLSTLLSAAFLWLAATGVRERQRLRPERELPRLRLRRLGLRVVALFATSAPAFAVFESYLHWRAGLGFHGPACLLGPVHRNALPLLGALALLGAALAELARYLLAWLRAAVRELLRPRLAIPAPRLRQPRPHVPLVAGRRDAGARARAPPLPA